MSGIIRHQLVGEGQLYRCDCGVNTTIRGDIAYSDRREGGIAVANGVKSCIGIGDERPGDAETFARVGCSGCLRAMPAAGQRR